MALPSRLSVPESAPLNGDPSQIEDRIILTSGSLFSFPIIVILPDDCQIFPRYQYLLLQLYDSGQPSQ